MADADSFYKRVLPDTCVGFSTAEGRALFKEALLAGGMECYMRLAEQFTCAYDTVERCACL